MNHFAELEKKSRRNTLIILAMLVAVLAIGVACLFVGSSNMSFADALDALLGGGTGAQSRIIWKIRVPRVLAAILAGAGLSVAGLVMQTTLSPRSFASSAISTATVLQPELEKTNSTPP